MYKYTIPAASCNSKPKNGQDTPARKARLIAFSTFYKDSFSKTMHVYVISFQTQNVGIVWTVQIFCTSCLMAMCVPKIHGATKVYREIPIPGMGKVETSKYNDNVFNTNYGFLALI